MPNFSKPIKYRKTILIPSLRTPLDDWWWKNEIWKFGWGFIFGMLFITLLIKFIMKV